MGKSSINGPFSIAMLNYQRVHLLTGFPLNPHDALLSHPGWQRIHVWPDGEDQIPPQQWPGAGND